MIQYIYEIPVWKEVKIKMAERFIPCLMKPTKVCEPDCPNYSDAVGLRKEFEARFSQQRGRQLIEEEIIAEFAKINPLLPVLAAPDHIANSCPQSTVRKVEIRPFA